MYVYTSMGFVLLSIGRAWLLFILIKSNNQIQAGFKYVIKIYVKIFSN